MSPLEIVGVGMLAALGALIAHEATHALVAVAVPGVSIADVQVWPRAYVDAHVPAGHPEWVDVAFALSPTFVGLVGGSIAVAIWGFPPATVAGLLVVAAWGLFTNPSAGDLASAGFPDGDDDVIINVFGAFSIIVLAGIMLLMGGDVGFWGQAVGLAGTAQGILCLAGSDSACSETRAGA